MTRITTYQRLTEIFRRVMASEITATKGRDECLSILAADTERPEVVIDMMRGLEAMVDEERRNNAKSK